MVFKQFLNITWDNLDQLKENGRDIKRKFEFPAFQLFFWTNEIACCRGTFFDLSSERSRNKNISQSTRTTFTSLSQVVLGMKQTFFSKAARLQLCEFVSLLCKRPKLLHNRTPSRMFHGKICRKRTSCAKRGWQSWNGSYFFGLQASTAIFYLGRA